MSKRDEPKSGVSPLMLTMSNAPSIVGISRSGLYRMAKNGHIRCVKHGRTTLVDVESVRAYLATLPPIGPGPIA